MIITTTPTVEGRPVKDYLGIVSGEVVVDEPWGSTLSAHGDSLLVARHRAELEMVQRAEALGATAVVGIAVVFEIYQNRRFLVVTGTAVVIP